MVCTRYAAERYQSPNFVPLPVNFLPPCRKYLVRLGECYTPSQILMWELAQDMLSLKKAA